MDRVELKEKKKKALFVWQRRVLKRNIKKKRDKDTLAALKM